LRAATAERQGQFGQGPDAAVGMGRATASQEERLARLREQVAERELKLLPAAAQRAAFEEKIANLKKEIARLAPIAAEDRAAEEALLKAQIEMMNAQAQVDALAEPAQLGPQGDPMVNALERIGGSFGAADTGMTQVRKLDQIHNELRALKQETKNGNNNTAIIAGALT